MTDWKTFLYLGGILLGVIVLGLVLGLERYAIAETFETFESKQEETNQNHENESQEIQEGFNEPINIAEQVNLQENASLNKNITVNGLIKAGGLTSTHNWPAGWTREGLQAWDIYSNATIGAGQNGNVNARLIHNGQLCLGNTCIDENHLKVIKGEKPITIKAKKTGRRLHNNYTGASFANFNRGSMETLFIEPL
jgi:hypothetical protein